MIQTRDILVSFLLDPDMTVFFWSDTRRDRVLMIETPDMKRDFILMIQTRDMTASL